jgi:Tfp pilus assembly protein FimT
VWAWDDTSVSGGNTLDACTLFDTNANGNVNVALCLTLEKSGKTVAIKSGSPVMYSCGDARNDRCTSTVSSIDPQGSYCELETNQTGQYDAADTQAFCDIKVTALHLSSATNLLNTCSYPSQQPNSDPSDCVLVPGAVGTTTVTTPSSSSSVTLKDSATVSPTASVGSNGTVTFQLFGPYADNTGDCSGTALWSSGALSLASGTTGTDSATGGSPSVSAGGFYKWKATYSGATGINGSDSGCGELQHVTTATITSS